MKLIRNKVFQFAYILFLGFGMVAWVHRDIGLLLVPIIAVVIVGIRELLKKRGGDKGEESKAFD